MDNLRDLKKQMPEIQKQLGLDLKDPDLLLTAFIHPSFLNENFAVRESNQRLEFIGDAALGLIITDWLYSRYPLDQEGELSYKRSILVDSKACAAYVKQLYISPYLLLSKGQRVKDPLIADLFESVIGAIYVDGGLEKASQFVHTQLSDAMEAILSDPPRNWKAELQDYAQKIYGITPTYRLIEEEGPDHAKVFCVQVMIGHISAIGSGASKKIAQAEAAKNAMEQVNGKK